MFRSYVNPTLEQVVNLVLTVPSAITEVHQCLGKCLAALITSIGPELQGEHQFCNNYLVNVFDIRSVRDLVAALASANSEGNLTKCAGGGGGVGCIPYREE